MSIEEYRPGSVFSGAIGRTVEESSPAWPAPGRARDGAPNVLFFVLDDVGYGQHFESGKGAAGRGQLDVDGAWSRTPSTRARFRSCSSPRG